jgi:two-component system LytT family response regulator
MNCIIIDDDEISRNAMEQMVGQVNFLHLKKICSSPVEALNILNEEKIDLILLDIVMPKMSGIDLIKSLEKPPLIILATAKKEYAVEAFECNVVDYLVKPISLDRFFKAVNKAKEIFEGTKHVVEAPDQNYIYIKNHSVLTKVDVKEILWVEASGDYITITTIDKQYVIHSKMKTIETKLPSAKFVRVHRSFIVSIDHISSIDDDVILIAKKPIPVGSLYKDNLMKRLNLL